ncbi:MAG: PLP-dependent transferase [Tepidisphaeraceae bacterium]
MSQESDSSPSRLTRLVQQIEPGPGEFRGVQPPVHKASTVIFPNVQALRTWDWYDKERYTYGLHGTPTTVALERRIAALEGGEHCMLFPSGLAAIAATDFAFLSAGDELLLPDNAYGPNKEVADDELKRWGITSRIFDPMDLSSLRAELSEKTKLVWLEAAGSVTMEFPDLVGSVRTIREKAPSAVIALDNTWGAGLAFNAFELDGTAGIDVSVHALTKYPSGGGDVLMGSIVTRDRSLYKRIARTHAHAGYGVGANDVELVSRSMASLPLRYAAQDEAGRRFAQWCVGRREFKRVLHPSLPTSPGHEHWAKLCRAAAGLVTVEFDPNTPDARVAAFVDRLKLFKIGWSWGGPVSLVAIYRAAGMRKKPTPYTGTLVRFCIGLESLGDLTGDVEQALAGM